MLENADITIYNKLYNPQTRLYEWRRTQIPHVNWFGKQAASLSADGLMTADLYTVRIPAASAPPGYVPPEQYDGDGWTLRPGDIVAKGLTGNIQAPGQISGEKFTVTAVRDNRRGSPVVQHWMLEGT